MEAQYYIMQVQTRFPQLLHLCIRYILLPFIKTSVCFLALLTQAFIA